MLGGVLEFVGWTLSDACRHAELRGCSIELAWPDGDAAYVQASYDQRVADEIAKDVIAGTIAVLPRHTRATPENDGMHLSLRICP